LRNLSLLLDFDEQYRRDRQQDRRFLHRRDRRLATEHDIDGSRASLATWLDAVSGHDREPAHVDGRLSAWRWMRVLFVVAGSVLGAAAMLGLLYYDGGRRINVTLIIGVALLQLLLALLTTAQAWIGWQPWHGVFQSLGARWLPVHAEPQSVLRALAAPLAERIAQSGGLAFGIAALIVLLSQVVIHDLAFGWSTTLQASAPAYHELTSALAWPWRDWMPSAVPSLALVDQSRYFRAAHAVAANPELLGTWWRFITMLWLFYVILPRIVLLALARAHLAWRVRHQLAVHPGRVALQERCTTPWIDSGEGAGTGTLPPDEGDTVSPSPAMLGHVLIRWADAGDPGLARQWLGADALVLDAGGSSSLDADDAVLEQARASGGPVIILARGWEPPTGELADFIAHARQRLDKVPIQLLPLAPGRVPTLPAAPALAPWQRFIKHLRQPGVNLVDIPVKGGAR
jgi:hypothetical protein